MPWAAGGARGGTGRGWMELSVGTVCASEGLFLDNAETIIPTNLCSRQVEGALQQIS